MTEQAPALGLPRGSRELLPAASRRRRALVHGLLGELERWGYEQVETPLVEYFDVVARGLSEADRAACVRFIEAGTGALVTLRADPTPQIARMLAQRLGGELAADAVQRWCYAADVVRQPVAAREPTEGHQVGVELIGDGDAWADVELVALCDAALRACGLVDFRIDLAHAQLARAAIAKLGLEQPTRLAVRDLLARKHTVALARLLAAHGVPTARAELIASLCDRIGDPRVVDDARTQLGALVEADHLAALAAVCDGLGEIAARVVVDLGEVRGYDYYSGVRVRVWARGVARPIVRGGRYDRLLAGYGGARPATGFAIDLDALEQALAHAEPTLGLPARAPAHVVAVPTDATAVLRRRAAMLSAQARAAGLRAWVQPASSCARAEELARAGDAATLTWLEPLRSQRRVHDGEHWRTDASWTDNDAGGEQAER